MGYPQPSQQVEILKRLNFTSYEDNLTKKWNNEQNMISNLCQNNSVEVISNRTFL